jgi:tRNA dimethylallyltransferase
MVKKTKSENQKIIFVIGSTASGKSQWALSLAQKYNGSIINIDSVQFYEGLVIGSAAPTEFEKKQVPHYLYNYVKPPVEMTAGQFLRDFYKLIDDEKIKYPLFVVGGTGFYIQALEKGMFDVPEIDRNLKIEIENEIKEFGNEKAYNELIQFDPNTQVHVNDAYRIGRALEVKRAFGKTMTQLQLEFENSKKFDLKMPFLKIGKFLDKEILFKNVTERTQKMLNDGIIDEVQALIQLGYSDWAPLKSVGYFEVLKYLNQQMTQENLLPEIVQSTMQLIKKQKTWFKRDKAVLWSVAGDQIENEIEQKIDLFVNESKM